MKGILAQNSEKNIVRKFVEKSTSICKSCEFRRKPRKAPNGQVDKSDRESNPAPPIYQFSAQNEIKTGKLFITV